MHESLRDPEIMSGALCFSGKRVLVTHLFGRVGPQLGRVAPPVKADMAPYPVEVALFSADAVVFYPQPVAHLVEQARRAPVRRRREAWERIMNCFYKQYFRPEFGVKRRKALRPLSPIVRSLGVRAHHRAQMGVFLAL